MCGGNLMTAMLIHVQFDDALSASSDCIPAASLLLQCGSWIVWRCVSIKGSWSLPAVDPPASIMKTGALLCHCLPTRLVGPWSTYPLLDLWQPPFQRIGEARKPGPPNWHLHGVDVSTCLQIGTLNAGALLNKEDLLCALGPGIWTASETHHTARAVPLIKGRMRKHGFHMRFSAPVAPYSTGIAQLKGLASGTSCFSDLPIRNSSGFVPVEVRDSTRFLQSFVQVSTHCVVQVITLYGPPISCAHSQPLQTTNLLLEAAFKIVTDFKGPSIIAGDLNTTLDSLPTWALLRNHGWLDAAVWSAQALRHPLQPTCRDATRHSFLLVNSRAAQALRVADVVPDFYFDSHPLLLGCFELQVFKAPRWQCLLPKTFDSVMFDAASLEEFAADDAPRLARSVANCVQSNNLAKGFQCWARECENLFMNSAVWSDGQKRTLPPGYRGRCLKFKPVQQPCSVPVIPKARDGDFDAALSQGNIFLRRLLRQVHRLQSLCRMTKRILVHSLAPDHGCVASAVQLWNACKHAKGFPGSFCQWLLYDQGIFMTMTLPPYALCEEISAVVRKFFETQQRLYILTKAVETREELLLDWKRGGAKAFAQLRSFDQPPLSQVVQEIPLSCKKVRWPKTGRTKIPLKSVPDVRAGDLLEYHGQEFLVKSVHESAVSVHPRLTPQEWPPKLVLRKTLVHPAEVDAEIRGTWGKWFHRDVSASTDDWDDAIAFIDTRLPDFDPMPYAPFEVCRWVHVLKGVSCKSARGSCGFSVQELKSIPKFMLPALFDLFHALEAGAAWPEALVFALVVCLPKTDGACTALQIRPITILSRLYRCWARYRSTEIVEWLSSKLPPTIAGGVKGMSVTDITAMVAHYLESSFDQGLPRLGAVFDIVKCFNALPRFPLLWMMIHLGINPCYVQAYENMLASFTRTFLVQGMAGVAEHSETGFPEGCSMSVIAMTCMAYLAHEVLSKDGTCAFVFADNWSFASNTLHACKAAYQALGRLCDAFLLELSPEKSWVWATTRKFRRQLQRVLYNGVRIPLAWHAKDLGVDVNYTRRRQKSIWKLRFHKMKNSMMKVRQSKLPMCFKQRLAFAGCSSKCNFGQALLQVSKSEFKSWRSATAKALGCNGPGENAKIALALTGDDCDPQFLDLLQRCCFWRRFLWKFTVFQEEFLRLLNKGGLANRPAGSLARSALLLGWTVEGAALIHPWFGSLDWLRCTGKFLHFALSQTWMRTVCAELTESRPGFNLHAVDLQGMQRLLVQLQPDELGIVKFFANGGNYTNDIVSKWDFSRDSMCPNCQLPDSRFHRIFECQAYDCFRSRFPGLFSQLRRLPEAVWRFGLVPLCADAWPLLKQLRVQPLCHTHPTTRTALHIFVDGSCFWPTNRLSSVAASAAVIADMSCKTDGTVHSCVLPGSEQSND